jgi:hypothetical protein
MRSNYSAVGRENGRSGVGCDPETRAGRRRRGGVACGEWGCVDVHQMRGDGTAARRDGGDVVRAQQQAGRAAGEGCRHRVVAVDAAAGADRRRRGGGGTRVSQQKRRRCGCCGAVLLKQNWHPCRRRSMGAEEGLGRGANAERDGRSTCKRVRRGGRSWRRDGMGGATHRKVARQRCVRRTGLACRYRDGCAEGQRGDRARACTEGWRGVHGRELQVWTRIGTGVVETETRAEHAQVEAGQNGRGSAWGERYGRGARRACGEGARAR